ncbi:MAG: hypothetical protein QOF77_2296 [Solirubrobacteraceae bacterium]|jgi:hypothetical protein|nr:hypothetical protein [Solirubrobacteraceae bacterium]
MGFLGHKSRREREWDEVRAQARDDLIALGEDIRSLDVDVQMEGVSQDALDRYNQAVEAYGRANQVFESARRPEDLAPVSETLEEGRYAMLAAKAHLEGRQPPERRAPCFFDPRHGPSTDEVDWAPDGGAPRPVPACRADALRVREGFSPHGRQVLVNGRPTEYWNAPAHYAPWAGGYYGGFGGGGMFQGLLVGSLLGGALGMAGGGLFGDDDGGWGGGDDGGGWGGGDDGGDFGGGGFDGGGFDF